MYSASFKVFMDSIGIAFFDVPMKSCGSLNLVGVQNPQASSPCEELVC